ncbi:MAG: hypothetical protein DME08_21160 [Candidatus Rokuibacteriota bacterium]|nr:MAG: hypothetical protein DME08_21160 [Candidatus Rokubacteria bacterium]
MVTAMKRRADAGPILATALLVCAAYYVGANVGFILRFPPATPSLLWPPNSILTATLLLSAPRRWGIYLLAALPAHLVAELGVFPVPLVLSLFVTNCSEALLAAICVRRFSDAPTHFDTLRRVVAFIVGAVLVAPFVSSFVDAAAVTALRDEPYWFVWRTRFFSNVLTELTLVPAIVVLITGAPAWIRRAPLRNKAEAVLLTAGLLGSLVAVFIEPQAGAYPIPGVPVPPLTFIVPFILWAALRFGSSGASLSMLASVLVAIWAATHGRGSFPVPLRAESVLALQIVVSILAIPLMYLAALIEERRRAEKALSERLRFEELLSRLSGAFVHLPSAEMDESFRTWLRRLGEFLGLERAALLRLSEDKELLTVSHCWVAPGIDPGPRSMVIRRFPETVERLFSEQPFVLSRTENHRDEPPKDEDARGQGRVSSQLTIPLVAGGRVLGGLAFDALAADRAWPEEEVQWLRLVAEVFASALARKETVDALGASELMNSAILASLSNGVAVVDRDGRVIAVNEDRGGARRIDDGICSGLFRLRSHHRPLVCDVGGPAQPAGRRRRHLAHGCHRAEARRAGAPAEPPGAGAFHARLDDGRAERLTCSRVEPAADRDPDQRPGRPAVPRRHAARPRRVADDRVRHHLGRQARGGGHPAPARPAQERRPPPARPRPQRPHP